MHSFVKGNLISTVNFSIAYDADVSVQTDIEGSVEIVKVLQSTIVNIHQRDPANREREMVTGEDM